MKRYWIITFSLLIFFLILFLIVEAFGVPILSDPAPMLKQPGPVAALVGVGLLVADVVLPVPSSLVMVTHGALFGVGVGTLLSLTGSVGAALTGFAVGRWGGAPLLARFVSPAERAQANRLLGQWGTLAIIVTRPVPLLAETVAIMAGASPLSPGRVALAALVGSLPSAVLYALAGATAATFSQTGLILGLLLLIAGGSWLIGRWLEPRLIGNGVPPDRRKAH